MALENLFDARLRELNRVVASFVPRFNRLRGERSIVKVCDLTADLARAALGLGDAPIANFVAGVPIPIMLSARKRLTVDLAPVFMVDFERHYGLSPRAFIEFARRKMIIVNIRDYDPLEDKQVQAAKYAPWQSFVEELFAQASSSVYFLSVLRDVIFDNLPTRTSDRMTLRASFNASKERKQLDDAEQDAKPFGLDTSEGAGSRFRGEPPSLTAVRWHLAYSRCMEAFIEREQIAEKDLYFKRVISSEPGAERGRDFLQLSKLLRYLHLNYSAPLSGSFGGAYNLQFDDEFPYMRAVRAGIPVHHYDYMFDELRDFIGDLQIGRIENEIISAIPLRHREILRYFGVEAYIRDGPATHHDHYEDQSNIAELERYVIEEDGTETRLRDIAQGLDDLIAGDRKALPAGIVELAAMSQDIRMTRAARLSRITEGHQTIDVPLLDRFLRARSVVVSTDPRAIEARLLARDQLPGQDRSNMFRSLMIPGLKSRVIGKIQIFKGPPR